MGSHHFLTVRADRITRRVSISAAFTVSITAAAMSFHGLQLLASESGLGALSVLYPIAVDGTMLLGALLCLRNSLLSISTWYGWFLTMLGVGGSVAGNVASSPSSTLSALALHASIPLCYALTLEALLSTVKHNVVREAAEEAAEQRRAERQALAAERKLAKALILPEPVVAPQAIRRATNTHTGPTQMSLVLALLSEDENASTSAIRAAIGSQISYNTISKCRARLEHSDGARLHAVV